MIVLLNGSFGIGKTTVARALRARLPGSAIFDPETIGWVLRRLPRWVPLDPRGRDDYQHLASWRRLAVAGIRVMRALRPHVIVPMAFSDRAYLGEIRSGALRADPRVLHVCLVAPQGVVEERLRRRGADPDAPEGSWQLRRAAECCAAHADAAFEIRVDATGTPEQVTETVLARIRAEESR